MKRFLPAVAALALVAAFATAQDQDPAKPADPKQPAQPKAAGGFGKVAQPEPKANPFGTAIRPVSATVLLSYEENLELLEAQRDTKRAHVRAADVAVKLAEIPAANAERLFANKVVSKEEVDRARLEVEAAKAQLDIRAGELKEIEVRIKYAKKRLDDAKATNEKAPAKVDPPPSRN